MSKRVLMAATVPSMIGQFNMNNIKIIQELGYVVDVASDFTDESVWPRERVERLKSDLDAMGVECIQIDFSRSPFAIGRHIKAYKDAVELVKVREYSFIHTHTPIASAILRLVAHKTKTKIIYTAHGFHFFTGAPFKNWMVFYPLEKYLSKYTDVLITINKEDYERASKGFSAGRTVYVPGIGVDVKKFQGGYSRESVRASLGIPESAKLLISIGELSHRKNHSVVINALEQVDKEFYYIIVGKGELRGELESLIESKGLSERVKLLGFRTDTSELLQASDIFVFPSLQEGLPVALMEAMASGLPCIVSKIRGNVDLIDESTGRVIDNTVEAWAEALNGVDGMPLCDMGHAAKVRISDFGCDKVNNVMRGIYEEMN